MKIREIKAYPTSFPLPKSGGVRLGIGQAVKRDCVMVKVTTESGLVGWGESHHGRAHTAIAKLIETTLSQLILGMEATDTTGIWAKIYKYQLGSHGMGAGTAMASGMELKIEDTESVYKYEFKAPGCEYKYEYNYDTGEEKIEEKGNCQGIMPVQFYSPPQLYLLTPDVGVTISIQ